MSTTTTTTAYASPPPPPESRLPLGVAILAILIGIVGFLLLVAGLLGILDIALLGGYLVYGVGIAAALITFVLGLILLGVAGGLWNQRLWALALAILVLLILLGLNLYRIFFGHGASVLATAVELFLLIYLIAVSGHFD